MRKLLSTIKEFNATCWIFIIFIGALTLFNIFKGDRAFSETENRPLAQFPQLDAETLFIDKPPWTLDFEDYFSDQFVFRDEWIGIRAAAEKAAGKGENNEIYFAAENNLIAKPVDYTVDTIKTNIKNINEFAAGSGAKVYLALVPNSICVNSSLLPRFAGDGDQKALIASAYAGMDGVETVDILPLLEQNASRQLFYRTDHHPTSLGAYYIYGALSKNLGFKPHAISDYSVKTVSASFSGTAKNRSGAWWIPSDSIEVYSLPGEDYTLTVSDGKEEKTYDSPYVAENLKATDQYTMFLGGNAPLHVIRNKNGEGKIMIVMDSFSHCIAPFIAAHYGEVHLIDLRYFHSSVLSYMEENGIDKVLILFSVNNFITERNFVFLNG